MIEKGKSFLSFLCAKTSRACHTVSLARVTGAIISFSWQLLGKLREANSRGERESFVCFVVTTDFKMLTIVT